MAEEGTGAGVGVREEGAIIHGVSLGKEGVTVW